jgi:hypothetical protein
MRIIRYRKTPPLHSTIIVANDEDPFGLEISRGEGGELELKTEDHSHAVTILFNKKDEEKLRLELNSI